MDKNKIGIFKRRHYFVEKEFQLKFILKFCSLVAISGLLTIVIVYLLALHSTTVSVVNSRVVVQTTASFILPLLIQTVVIVLVIISLATIMVTLLVSHKIAGPLYRFKKVMQLLGGGDFSGDFKIRQLDQLQELADIFNAMIIKTRGELKILKDDINLLKEKLDCVNEHDFSEDKKVHLKEIKTIVMELLQTIHHFKI